MQIELTRRGFFVHLDSGKHRRYSYLALLPLLSAPVLFVVALLLHDPILSDLRLVRQDPRYLVAAASTLMQSSSAAIENLLAVQPALKDSQLPTLNIFASKRTLTDMQVALRTGDPRLGRDPGGDRPYLPAIFLNEQGQIYDCKVSLRGDNQWHHWPSKPSLRVKIRKSDVRQGRRYVELSRPKDTLALKNWIPQEFARELGLLSENGDLVRLFINQKYAGVYLRSMRPGEPLAIAHGRMPGTFFKGDVERDILWNSITPWTVHGEDDEANVESFRTFLGQLRRPATADSIARLQTLLDDDAYARWAALMIVVGSVHTDEIHNHVYFVCSNRGRIEAVPWDTQSFGMLADATVPPDTVQHPVMNAVLRDPRWVHRRNEYIGQLLGSLAAPQNIHPLIDDSLDRMLPDLRADTNLASLQRTAAGWRLVPRSVLEIEEQRQEIKDWTQQRHTYLSEYLSDARVHVEPHPERLGASLVHVFGSVAVRLAGESDALTTGTQLLFPGLSQDRQRYTSQPFARATTVEYLTPTGLAYDVNRPPSDLRFSNAITGQPVTPQNRRPADLSATLRSIHPSEFPVSPTDDVVLGPGAVELTEDLKTCSSQRLIVRPGTSIRMAAGVGIYSRGMTTVEGTRDNPVEIVAAGQEPWAALAIYGPATAGSRVEHLRIRGGSLGSDGIAHFKGMLNVYNCPQVVLRHCEIGPNRNSDDAVNIAESTALVEDCVWRSAAADGLDLDLCECRVRRCRWEDCGNDGLDLMGCNARVADCEFTGCGDKGISVGEGSQLVVSGSLMDACDIGIEVKDGSSVLVRDCVLQANRLALHSYQKHWLYGSGGRTALLSCTLLDSREADLSVEKRSLVLLCRTAAGSIAEGEQRVREVDELGAEWDVK